jgi:di/tricarboxylate transporter
VALLLAAAWVVGGVTTPAVAMSGYATSNWVLVVAVLAVGGVIASTGLLYRLALWAVARTGGGFVGQALTLAAVGLAIGPAIPNATARTTLFAPAISELAEALNYRAGSRAAAGLAMAVHSGFGQMTAAFLTSSTTAVLVYAVLPESSRASLTWVGWAIRTAPTTVLLLGILLAAVVVLYRPRPQDALADGAAGAGRRPFAEHGLGGFALQQALLGPMTRQEKVAGAVTLGMLVGFATQPLHGIDPGWVGVVALGVLAVFGVMNAEGLRAVNWSFALLFGILASMVNVFAAVKLDTWIAGLTADTMSVLTHTPVLFVAVLTVISLAISFVLRWQAAAPLLTIALTPVAVGAGWDPWIVGLIAILACNAFFLPYQSTIYLALYHGTGGKLFTHAQARPMSLVYAVATLVSLCASVPFWRAWGLM